MDRTKLQDEQGFTLIEVALTVVIIGILAMIALPSLSKYAGDGHDASAKTDVRNVVGQMEACRVSADDLSTCPDVALPEGSQVTPLSGGGYEVKTHSDSGRDFLIQRTAAGMVRSCAASGGGCKAGAW